MTVSVTVQGDVEVNLELAPEILADQVVVVSGSREQELSENSNTKVDVIPSTMLHDTGYETVRDVLSEEPGIITRSGSSGNRSQTQIQGIDSRQSLILIDGLPIVGAKGIKSGILNMDRQSVGRLDRIEIVKGASSALYGSDAIGGVINMITREPTQALEGSVTASGGTLNRFDARTDIGFIKDKWDWYLAKPVKRGIELFTSVDNLLDSRDSGLTSIQPTFFRADPGRLARVGIRWEFGVE